MNNCILCALLSWLVVAPTVGCDSGNLPQTQNHSSAVSVCGDGVLDSGEECDGADLAGATCVSLGWAAGPLACNGACVYDSSECADCDAVENLVNQTGCAGGDACTFIDSLPNIGCAPPGTVPFYHDCGLNAECGAGSVCVHNSADAATCLPFCDPVTGAGCPDNDSCILQMSTAVGYVGFCNRTSDCDPVNDTGCATDQHCMLYETTVCTRSGFGGVDEPCQQSHDCEAGLACPSSTGRCTELCYSTPDCGLGACGAIGTIPDYPALGFCQ